MKKYSRIFFFLLLTHLGSETAVANEYYILTNTDTTASVEKSQNGQWVSDNGTILVQARIDGNELIIGAGHRTSTFRFAGTSRFAVYNSTRFSSPLVTSADLVGKRGEIVRLPASEQNLYVVLAATEEDGSRVAYRTLNPIKVRPRPVVAPAVTSVSSSPRSAPAGSEFTFNVTLDRDLPSDWNVYVFYGADFKLMNGSARSFTHRSPPVTQVGSNRVIEVEVRDGDGRVKSTGTGRYDVTELPVPAVTSVSSSPRSAPAGSEFTFNVTLDRDLPSDWNVYVFYGADFKLMNGSARSFTHRSPPVTQVGSNRVIEVEVRDGDGRVKSTGTGRYDVTELPVPAVTSVSSSPRFAPAGSEFTFNVTLDRDLPSDWSVYVFYGADFKLMNGSGRSFTHRSPPVTQVGSNRAIEVEVRDDDGRVQSTGTGRYDVTELPVPVVTSVSSSPRSAPAGSEFTFNVTLDRDLPSDWNVYVFYGADFKLMNGSARSFTRRSPPVTQVGSNRVIEVEVRDDDGRVQSTGTGRYDVTEPPVPAVTSVSSSPRSAPAGSEFTFNVTLDRDLPSDWNVYVFYGADFKLMNGSGRSFTHRSPPVTQVGSNRAIEVEVRDDDGRVQSTGTGQYEVTDSALDIAAISEFLNSDALIGGTGLLAESNLDSPLSRAESVLLIDTFLGLLKPEFKVDLVGSIPFPDVDYSLPYAASVTRLASFVGDDGVPAITSENRYFYPFRSVSRAEFLGLLLQGMNVRTSASDANLEAVFVDADFSTAAWAEQYFATAYRYNLISGFYENGVRLLKPFETLSTRDLLVVLGIAKNLTDLHLHSAIGFSDQVVINSFSSSVGPAFVPFAGYLTTSPIQQLELQYSGLQVAGMRCQRLNAISVVDAGSGAQPIYRWSVSHGYFQDPVDHYSSVTLCPIGESTVPYVVSLQGYDGLGYATKKEFILAASLFEEAPGESVPERVISFTGWGEIDVDSTVQYGNIISLDYSKAGFKMGELFVGSDSAVVELLSSEGSVLFSGRGVNGSVNLDTGVLKNEIESYQLRVSIYMSGQKVVMRASDFREVQVLPSVSVFGYLYSVFGQSDPGFVVVNGVEVEVIDGQYSVLLGAERVRESITVEVPAALETNLFETEKIEVIRGKYQYRLDLVAGDTTELVLAAPIAFSPASSSEVPENTLLVLSFSAVDRAEYYEASLYDRTTRKWQPSDQIGLQACSNGTCRVEYASGLPKQDRALWSVRAFGNGGWSRWSASTPFTVIEQQADKPETPNPISPLSEDEVPENTLLVLSFSAVDRAEYYEASLYDRTTRKWQPSDQIGLQACSNGTCRVEYASGLPKQDRALWSVRAFGNGGWSRWSASTPFTVIEQADKPETPNPISPLSEDEVPENTLLVLSFSAVDRAEYYEASLYDRTTRKWQPSDQIGLQACSNGTCRVEYASGLPKQDRALWSVRAFGNGGWSRWSASTPFTVIEQQADKPETPNPISPLSEDEVPENTLLVLSFSAVDRAEYYEASLYDRTTRKWQPSDQIGLQACSNGTCRVEYASGLPKQDRALWSVRAFGNGGWSRWSASTPFTVIEQADKPETPNPISPLSEDEVPENTLLVLSFSAVDRAEYYEASLYDRTTRKWQPSDQIGLQACSNGTCRVEYASGLPKQDRALWSVRAFGNGGWSRWSASTPFTVIEQQADKPETPNPISPLSEDEVPENTLLVLSFSAVDRAEYYEASLYDRTTRKWQPSDQIGLQACSNGTCRVEYASGLPKQDRALWSVRAFGNGGWSRWSASTPFTVIEQQADKAETPNPISPLSEDEVPENTLLVLSFSAVDRAEYYEASLYDRTTRKWQPSDQIGLQACSNGTCRVEYASGLPKQDRALWSVRAFGNGGWSRWSASTPFTVIEQQADKPETPNPISPLSEDEVPENTLLVLSFGAVDRAEYYEASLYDRTTRKWQPSDQIGLQACSNGTCRVEYASGLPKQDRALWSVRAFGNGGWSRWSASTPFTVGYQELLLDTGPDVACVYVDEVLCWPESSKQNSAAPLLLNPTSISVGINHACALDDSGVRCWGSDGAGPVTVPDLLDPTWVSVGDRHSCAIVSDGVRCWGFLAGQEEVPALQTPEEIHSGSGHNCVLDPGEEVVCWGGFNYHGELDVPLLQNPHVLSVGPNHNCAIDDIGVVCWGANSHGQTTSPDLDTPVAVASGSSHSCAIDSGRVICWGDNSSGQLDVPEMDDPTSISAGALYSCAMTATGIVCWGSNHVGQLNVPVSVSGTN